ncbi:MAG: Diaminopimelate epimerase [Chlamydiae bacterium]|nr:Diaminopimelate epimerase [Chlamydiota bacterium]
MRFFKYTGLGNDFLIFEGKPFDAQTIRELTDRHFGIGADGVLFVDTEDFAFSIYNADGLRALMCGNGLRCVAKYLHDARKVKDKEIFEIKSDHALHQCYVDGNIVSCSLAEPTLIQKDPYVVDAGAKHVVLFEKFDLKKALKLRKNFNANVNFFFENNHIHTFEKGVEAFTLACGTGALSCFFVLNVNAQEFVMRSKKTLYIFKEKNVIWMTGECTYICEGTVEKTCLESIFVG